MNKHKLKRLMAYIYMPLIFSVLGIFFVYLATAPVIKLVTSLGSMIIAEDRPDFKNTLGSIYKPLPKDVPTAEQPAEEVPTVQKVSQSDIVFPTIGEQYGQLTCERIGLDGPVYFGDSSKILRAGIGQYEGSLLPGFERMILLSAHNTTFFAPLKNAQAGDILTFDTSYGHYEYQVSETKILDESDQNAVPYDVKQEKLVMYTCYPFETMLTRKTQRLFVYADKIAGPVVE